MIVEKAGTNPQALRTGSLNMQASFAVRRCFKIKTEELWRVIGKNKGLLRGFRPYGNLYEQEYVQKV
jgi:hypothetical protein